MSITKESEVIDVWAATGYPEAFVNVDINDWTFVDCNTENTGVCGSYDSYYYIAVGSFLWDEFDTWKVYCDYAYYYCADYYDISNYDGWAKGIFAYFYDVLDWPTNTGLAVCPGDGSDMCATALHYYNGSSMVYYFQ